MTRDLPDAKMPHTQHPGTPAAPLPRHVMITGAGGHLGRKLFDDLAAKPGYLVSGMDLRAIDHPAITQADLAGEPVWAEHLQGIDTVVHLAADRAPGATWPSAIRHNMDATLALYHFAAEKGVRRVVFASSNWVMGDKRFTDGPLDDRTPPGPVNAYGMSKLFGERTGAYFAAHRGLSVICLRIGWTQWTHANQPGAHMAMGRWGQEMWLSDRDFLGGMEAAIQAENVSFAVLNLMSDNPGMRWDLAHTRRVIGYQPRDGHTARITPAIRLKSALKKALAVTIPRYIERTHPDW